VLGQDMSGVVVTHGIPSMRDCLLSGIPIEASSERTRRARSDIGHKMNGLKQDTRLARLLKRLHAESEGQTSELTDYFRQHGGASVGGTDAQLEAVSAWGGASAFKNWMTVDSYSLGEVVYVESCSAPGTINNSFCGLSAA
jgi:hypothetical protein